MAPTSSRRVALAAVLPRRTPDGIVLISDGTATEGDLDRALDQLVSRKIAVDVLKGRLAREYEVWSRNSIA